MTLFIDVFCAGMWADLAKLKDPSLRHLASRLQSSVVASKAAGTTDAYRRAFLRWRNFARSKDEIQEFPAKTEHVALYLQHLMDTTRSHTAVDSAIYAIQWAHGLAGIPSPTDSPIICGLRQTAKRLSGTRVVNKKEPISADMIKSLVNRSNLENLLDLRNLCIFLLAYTGFFRIEEAFHIKYGDICFHDNYVAINVDKSKTDQLRKGNEVVIAKGSNPDTCPVKILSTYLARIKQDPLEHDNYIFRPLRKSRSGHKLVSVNKPLSYSTIRDHFKASFKDIVPDISRFGTHSLRAGGASAAANAGVNDRLFQRHGRWKTVSAMNGYVDDNLESRLTVSKMLGI